MIIKIKVVERKPKFTKEKRRSPASQMEVGLLYDFY